MTEPKGYHTRNEIQHINYIAAGGTPSQRLRGVRPETLIKGYLKGARLRTVWECEDLSIDKEEVIRYAEGLL